MITGFDCVCVFMCDTDSSLLKHCMWSDFTVAKERESVLCFVSTGTECYLLNVCVLVCEFEPYGCISKITD